MRDRSKYVDTKILVWLSIITSYIEREIINLEGFPLISGKNMSFLFSCIKESYGSDMLIIKPAVVFRSELIFFNDVSYRQFFWFLYRIVIKLSFFIFCD